MMMRTRCERGASISEIAHERNNKKVKHRRSICSLSRFFTNTHPHTHTYKHTMQADRTYEPSEDLHCEDMFVSPLRRTRHYIHFGPFVDQRPAVEGAVPTAAAVAEDCAASLSASSSAGAFGPFVEECDSFSITLSPEKEELAENGDEEGCSMEGPSSPRREILLMSIPLAFIAEQEGYDEIRVQDRQRTWSLASAVGSWSSRSSLASSLTLPLSRFVVAGVVLWTIARLRRLVRVRKASMERVAARLLSMKRTAKFQILEREG